jgi:hypothetical protein
MLDVSSVLPSRDREGVGESRLFTASEGIGARVIFSRWNLIYVPVSRGSRFDLSHASLPIVVLFVGSSLHERTCLLGFLWSSF